MEDQNSSCSFNDFGRSIWLDFSMCRLVGSVILQHGSSAVRICSASECHGSNGPAFRHNRGSEFIECDTEHFFLPPRPFASLVLAMWQCAPTTRSSAYEFSIITIWFPITQMKTACSFVPCRRKPVALYLYTIFI